MPDLAVIADLPDEIVLAAGVARSRVQIAKTGKFKDPRYGRFAITEGDFDRWIANFQALNRSEDRAGLPVDVDHGPEKRGDTQAAGWVTALEKREGGTQLWATVEWNDLGRQLVGERRYRYLSPSYVHDFEDEQGKKHGTALLGVALTNRPFLTMATVSLAREPLWAVEDPPAPPDPADSSDSRPAMPDLTALREALGLGADVADDKVLEAAVERANQPEPKAGETKSLEQAARDEGKVLLDAGELGTLKTQAELGAAASKQLHDQRFETAFDKALDEGRITPAQRDSFKELYEINADSTVKALDGLPQAVSLEATGHGGGPEGAGIDPELRKEAEGFQLDDERAQIHTRALELMRTDKDLDYGGAVERASTELAGV